MRYSFLEVYRHLDLKKRGIKKTPDAKTNANLTSTTTTTATQLTDISVNEVLIPAKNDVTVAVNGGDFGMDTSAQYAAVALGEAACFQYINEATKNEMTSAAVSANQISVIVNKEQVKRKDISSIHDLC